MARTALFIPDSIRDMFRADLPGALRAIADSLDAGELDGKFVVTMPVAGGRYDDRLHLQITVDVAAPIVKEISLEETGEETGLGLEVPVPGAIINLR